MSADTKTKYPSYYVTKHFTGFLNRGTQVVHSTSSSPEILSFCALNQNSELVVQLINVNDGVAAVSLTGLKTAPVKSVSTMESKNWEENAVESKVITEGVMVKLEGNSVNTLVFEN
jgi:hypothetical protein